MALTPAVSAIAGSRAAFASPIAVERGGDAAFGGDDVGAALEELRRQARRHRRRLRRQRVLGRGDRRPDSVPSAARARGWHSRARARSGAAHPGRSPPRRARRRRPRSLPTPTCSRDSARRTSASWSATVLRASFRLQRRFRREEPALGDERGERLARVFVIGRGRQGVGGGRGAAVAHAAPEIESPTTSSASRPAGRIRRFRP